MNDKAKFIAKAKTQIHVYNSLILAAKVLKDKLADWDNKVINRRIETALAPCFAKPYYSVAVRHREWSTVTEFVIRYADPDGSYWNDGQGHGGRVGDLTFNIDLVAHPITLTSRQERLNYAATVKGIDKIIADRTKSIADLTDCIENYDLYAQRTAEIKAQIEAYDKFMPWQLRKRINFDSYTSYF